MEEFKRVTNAFNYVFERTIAAGEVIILKLPQVSANKRGVGDIGWVCDGDVTLFATLSAKPQDDKALWQEIAPNDDLNKTISGIKIVNNGGACSICVRVLLN